MCQLATTNCIDGETHTRGVAFVLHLFSLCEESVGSFERLHLGVRKS